MTTAKVYSLDRTLSLFKIEQGLEELLGMMEAAQEEGDSAAAEAIDKAMGEYVQAEVRKVDSIAGAIRGYEALALQAELESERAKCLPEACLDRAHCERQPLGQHAPIAARPRYRGPIYRRSDNLLLQHSPPLLH